MVPPKLDRRGSASCSRSWPRCPTFDPRRRTMTAPRYVAGACGPAGCSLDDVRQHAAGLHPDLVRRLVALGLLDAEPRRRAAICGSPVRSSPTVARIQRLRAGLCAQLRRARAGARPARPHRRAGGRTAPAIAGSRRIDRGHEPADPEVAGGPARRADQGAAVRAHRGRRRAPAAGPARPARGSGAAAARPGGRRPRRRCARDARDASWPAGRRSPAPAPRPARCSSPSGWPGCWTPPSGRPSGSRTSTSRSSTCCSPCVDEGSAHRGRPAAARSTASPGTRSWPR